MFRKSSFLTSLLLTGCLMASGCAALLGSWEKNNLLFTDKDIDDIFKAYTKDASQAKERRSADLRKNIKRIDVTRKEGEGEKEFLVSVDLENASLKDVVEIILTKTETPFFLQDIKLAGAISGRFEKVPFIRALNIILNSEGYAARMSEEGILFIRASYEGPSVPQPPAPQPAAPQADVFPSPGAAPPSPEPVLPAPGAAPPSPEPALPAPGAAPPSPEPAPGGPQPSSFRDISPPAMFRRTTLLVQNVPAPPRPVVPPIPGVPPLPLAPTGPSSTQPPLPPGLPGLPGLPEAPGAAAPRRPAQPEISVEYPLQHLNTDSAEKILSRLFPPEGGGGGGALPGAVPGVGGGGEAPAEPVRFGIEPTRNTVIIRGPRDQVLKIKKVLQTIDREPQHVLIEVLFLEVSADALESLSLALRDYTDDRLSALSTNIGSETARALQFTFQSLARGNFATLKYTAIFDVLFRKNLARVIARPYLASLTGKTSALKITEDRSIVVQSAEGGTAVASTKEISSGVELKITPTVHLSGSINMQIEVEESEFLPSTGNIASSKNTNRAQNIMQVGGGESIIIGGLMLNKRQWAKGGLPWLREVPILNIFTSSQRRTEVDKEVLVVVTPHLYSPGLRTPLPFLEVFQKDPIIKYTTPTERLDFLK